jgi:hypothetical protein
MTQIDAIVNAAKSAQYGSVQIQYESIVAAVIRETLNQYGVVNDNGEWSFYLDDCLNAVETLEALPND